MKTSFSSLDFRQTMGKFATGVTVVTTPDGEGVHGMTANAFMSVSLEPPLVLVSVSKRANTHRNIKKANCFGVNILRDDQRDLSDHFAGRLNVDLEQKLQYHWHDDIPLLSDCLANIACRLWTSYDGGDHTLYVGEVLALKHDEANPLIFFEGSYRTLEQ